MLIGLVVGSFINVVAHRVPMEMSVVSPRSRCPGCETQIRAWDNIPVLSWFLLRGRCRDCSRPISARYPAVEALCGLLFLLVFFQVSGLLASSALAFGWASFHGVLFVSLLLAVTLIDLDHFIIPDMLSLPGCLVGLAFAFVAPEAIGVSWQESAVGAVSGSGFLLLIAVGYAALRGREGMGMGDVKLMTTIGAFLGVYAIPFVIFSAAFQGSVLAILWLVFSGKPDPGEPASVGLPEPEGDGESGALTEASDPDAVDESYEGVAAMQVPFGPFLALGSLEWYLFSDYLSALFPLY